MDGNAFPVQPKGLRELRTYQLAKELAYLTYDLTACFPKQEYRLVWQMRGAALSVFGNIAEGYGRNSMGDYIRFCEISRSSLAELGSYVEFSLERNFISSSDAEKFLDRYNHNWNSLGALIRSLKKLKLDGNWDRSYTSLRDDSETYES